MSGPPLCRCRWHVWLVRTKELVTRCAVSASEHRSRRPGGATRETPNVSRRKRYRNPTTPSVLAMGEPGPGAAHWRLRKRLFLAIFGGAWLLFAGEILVLAAINPARAVGSTNSILVAFVLAVGVAVYMWTLLLDFRDYAAANFDGSATPAGPRRARSSGVAWRVLLAAAVVFAAAEAGRRLAASLPSPWGALVAVALPALLGAVAVVWLRRAHAKSAPLAPRTHKN
jgi:hypothetical protein